jgi:hypothetical protein
VFPRSIKGKNYIKTKRNNKIKKNGLHYYRKLAYLIQQKKHTNHINVSERTQRNIGEMSWSVEPLRCFKLIGSREASTSVTLVMPFRRPHEQPKEVRAGKTTLGP